MDRVVRSPRSLAVPPRDGRSFFVRTLATYISSPRAKLSQFRPSVSAVRSCTVRLVLSYAYQSRHGLLGARRLTRQAYLLTVYLPIGRDEGAVAAMSVRGKQVQNGTYEFDYMRVPDTRTRWEIFRDGIYNPQEGTYCGHPPKKWGLTLIFYACFYAGLAILFSICMKSMLATLSYEKPKWTLSSSLIGTNPGLGFRPIAENPDERSLIWYSASNATEVQKWTKLLDKFLEQYINSSLLPNSGRNQQICNYTIPAKSGNVCAVDVNNWGPCSPNQQYGFNNSAPCIFIKLNRIYGWVPEYYNDTENLPAEMPESLVSYIRSVDASWLNTVWISCKGENPHDSESIGELNYYPKGHGFPGFYYPYENIPGYLSPVVAVHFLRPTRNQLINVECRAWAKNIQYSSYRSEKKGAVHFELMVDE